MYALFVWGLIVSVAAVALPSFKAQEREAPHCRGMRCADKQGGASGRCLVSGRGWISKSPSLGDVTSMAARG